MTKTFECLVIGAGAAGAAAAYELKKLGYEVALLERTNSEDHKISGELISAQAAFYLKQMGIGIEEPRPIQYCRLVSPRLECQIKLPHPAQGISRMDLNEELLKLAENSKVAVFRGVSVKEYYKEDNEPYRVITNLGEFLAKNLFLTTGEHALNRLDPRRTVKHFLVRMKMQFRLPAERLPELQNQVMLFTYPGGYGGLSLLNSGVAQCNFLLKKRVFTLLRGHYEEIRAYLEYFNPQLGRMLKEAELVSEIYSISNIPADFLKYNFSGRQNIFYLGDTSVDILSLMGEGMTFPLLTAQIGALVFHMKNLKSEAGLRSLRKIIEQQMRWRIFLNRLFKTAPLMDLTILVARTWPEVLKIIFGKIDNPQTQFSEFLSVAKTSSSPPRLY